MAIKIHLEHQCIEETSCFITIKGTIIKTCHETCQINTPTHTTRQTSMLFNFPTRQNCCHKASVHVLVSHLGSVALIKENLSIITLIPSNPSTSASRRLFDIFLWHSWNSSSEPQQCRVNYNLRKKVCQVFCGNSFYIEPLRRNKLKNLIGFA